MKLLFYFFIRCNCKISKPISYLCFIHILQPVLDLYIRDNFSATLAYKKLLGVLQVFIEAEVTTKVQGDDLLRIMKSLHYLFKFIVRSRQLHIALDDSACPDDFESQLQGVLFSMAKLMKRSEGFVLLAQGACLKYIPCAIPELITVFNIQDLRFIYRISLQLLFQFQYLK